MTAPTPIDAAGFEALYRRVAPDLLAYLARRLPVGDDAADLLADVFLVAWRRRADLPRRAQEQRAWLFGVARNTLLAHHRVRARRDDATRAAGRPQDAAAAPTAGDDGGTRRRIMEALDGLPAADRELLTLVHWDGLPPREAATALGVAPGTVRVRLHRATRRLADRLDGDDPPAAMVRPRPAAG